MSSKSREVPIDYFSHNTPGRQNLINWRWPQPQIVLEHSRKLTVPGRLCEWIWYPIRPIALHICPIWNMRKKTMVSIINSASTLQGPCQRLKVTGVTYLQDSHTQHAWMWTHILIKIIIIMGSCSQAKLKKQKWSQNLDFVSKKWIFGPFLIF